MPGLSFPDLLDLVVNGEPCCQLMDTALIHDQNKECDAVTRKSLVHPDFISFFLNFLREASLHEIRASELDSSHSSRTNGVKAMTPSGIQNGNSDFATSAIQRMMSTPKLRNTVPNSKSCENDSASLQGASISSKGYGRAHGFSEPRRQGGKSSGKPKREPLSLSDFLSPAQSSSKKRSQKRGKRVQLCAVSNERVPHAMNNASVSHHETSCLSGLSNVSDAKSLANPFMSKSSRNVSFDIEEEFPVLSTSQTNKPPRRIKPTVVNGEKNDYRPKDISMPYRYHDCDEKEFNDSSNPFTSAPAIAPSPGKDLAEERGLLLSMKARGKSLDFDTEGTSAKPTEKSIEDISPVEKCHVVLDPKFVTDRVKVERLAQLYSYFISCFLVPNILSELCFITELLTAMLPIRKSEGSSLVLSIAGSLCDSSGSTTDVSSDVIPSYSDLLSTALNCIYFSITVIQTLVSSNILSILSRSTLSLLAQNPRIQIFLPNLPSQIMSIVEKLEIKEKDLSAERNASYGKIPSTSSVMFEAETDDRSNFASDKAFHAFRRHRDLFYALIREYDEKKHETGFQVQQHLSSKIKHLVSQVKTSGTYKPFVRLFVSQMLQEVGQDGRVTPCIDASVFRESMNVSGRVDLLSLLQRGDPEKFRRLQSRFFTASTSQKVQKTKDVLSEECFFYKEFILCADSYAINTHLCDELRRRISDLHSQQVQCVLDEAQAETSSEATVSAALQSLITSARLMGRFLGFIVFEPYGAADVSCINYGKSILLYAADALDAAHRDKHEIATIPWVVEYLKSAKFDDSSRGADVESLANKLFAVLRRRCLGEKEILSTGDVLISLLVTSLFEMSIFPDDFLRLLGKHTGQYMPKRIFIIDPDERKCHATPEELENPTFDTCCSGLVSFSLLYDTNPVLRDIRSMIISNNSSVMQSSRAQQPSRKIKPNREFGQESTIAQEKEKQLQHTLEEHFFRGQPSSLKRTVEFVAERCASNCVKRIRSLSILVVCDEAEKLALDKINRLREKIDANAEGLDSNTKALFTRDILTSMQKFAKDKMSKECDEFCTKAVLQCLKDLTSCETAEQVLTLATAIAKRKAIASVRTWLSTRLEELVTISVKARLTKVFAVVDVGDDSKIPLLCTTEVSSKRFAELNSFSSLLQTMKECIVKMTFETPQDQNLNICLNLPHQLRESDVNELIHIANSLLAEDTEDSDFSDTLFTMRQSLRLSSHLKSTLILTCWELNHKARHYFKI